MKNVDMTKGINMEIYFFVWTLVSMLLTLSRGSLADLSMKENVCLSFDVRQKLECVYVFF